MNSTEKSPTIVREDRSNSNSNPPPAEAAADPDADTIKMFVGQIPKSWDEQRLKKFFEDYGPVYHLNILRDKDTDASRGCCFVTFYHRKDAINAQNLLHNIYVMPGLSHPVQMKPADVENRNDRKLFIGMLSKSMGEDDVRHLFAEFGQIEDCTILREDGKSKGCAFLTFVSRSCAHQAIRKMNQSQVFEGCTKPIVVKFADSGKEKTPKKMENAKVDIQHNNTQQNMKMTQRVQQPQPVAQSGVEALSNLVSLLQQPGVVSLLESARVLQQLQQIAQPTATNSSIERADQVLVNSLANKSEQQQTLASSHPQQPSLAVQTSTANLLNLHQAGFLLNQPTFATNSSYLPLQNPHPFQFGGLPTLMAPISPNFQQAYGHAMISPGSSLLPQSTSGGGEKAPRGPDGCNLFIYHLPQEFTDQDLYSIFSQFGPILSAKVFIDKQTNLSKCFGFVSYSDEPSAQNAISGMNGVQVGNKRLKVQLKRSDMKPYDKPN